MTTKEVAFHFHLHPQQIKNLGLTPYYVGKRSLRYDPNEVRQAVRKKR